MPGYWWIIVFLACLSCMVSCYPFTGSNYLQKNPQDNLHHDAKEKNICKFINFPPVKLKVIFKKKYKY